MGLLITATIAFIVALIVRRKEAFVFRRQPTVHTWSALAAGMAAFLLSAITLIYSREGWVGQVIVFILIWAGLGFIWPWGYTLFVERSGLAAMGLTRERWKLSLILNVALGAMLFAQMAAQADLSRIDPIVFSQSALVLLTGNLFELFLFYGFIHLRLEKAFGVIPAIALTAAVYVLWHVGTQLPLEADPLAAALKLFLVGIMYQSVFSLTRNLLAIWPFFVGGGVLLDFVVNVKAMEHMSRFTPWALATLALMAASGLLMAWRVKQRGNAGRSLPAVS